MPYPRPTREEIDTHNLDLGDVLYEVRLMRWELNGAHREAHCWLDNFRAKMNDAARFSLIVIPVLLGAALALHLGIA